jgi:two-component system sensor histidine kinase PhoQ
VTRWSLRPLQMIGFEVQAIEDHRQSGFEQEYPSEIAPLTENLNILLKRERYQRQRYRNAMDDLAHSLKTPLAVLTGIGDQARLDAVQIATLREQTERMNQIVSYQLQKAGNLSDVSISKPVDLVVIIEKLLSALEKVYREKAIRVERSLPGSMALRMDEGDCLEVVGNLLDNAFKYGRERIQVTALVDDSRRRIQLLIEDDGDGLEQRQIEQIMNRGTRLDEVTEGQGIGLAVVADIVETYGIELNFGRGEAGGMKVSLTFQGV